MGRPSRRVAQSRAASAKGGAANKMQHEKNKKMKQSQARIIKLHDAAVITLAKELRAKYPTCTIIVADKEGLRLANGEAFPVGSDDPGDSVCHHRPDIIKLDSAGCATIVDVKTWASVPTAHGVTTAGGRIDSKYVRLLGLANQALIDNATETRFEATRWEPSKAFVLAPYHRRSARHQLLTAQQWDRAFKRDWGMEWWELPVEELRQQ